MYGPVRSKIAFYELQRLGWFNTPRYWDSVDEAIDDGAHPTLTARNAIHPGRGTVYTKSPQEMKSIMRALGSRASHYVFLEDPPESRAIQGEFTRLNGGWYLRFTTRDGALGVVLPQDSTIAVGITALNLLRNYMDGGSFNDMMLLTDLLSDRYNVETPVIEFSTFHTPVGCIPGRNTIIWECRSY